MVATPSGDTSCEGVGDEFFSAAAYRWSASEGLEVRRLGAGAPWVGVATLPHSNEPLGSAIVPCLEALVAYRGWPVALFENVDGPPPEHRFRLPANFSEFYVASYLPPLEEQAEFSHCAHPITPSQQRAALFRQAVRAQGVQALLLVHNDVFARHPYLYADRVWPHVEARLRACASRWFRVAEVPRVGWTSVLSALTYRYFGFNVLRPGAKTEAAGIYLPRALGIPVLTLELPMFDWSSYDEAALKHLRRLSLPLLMGGASAAERSELIHPLLRTCGGDVDMIAPGISAQVTWAVVEALANLPQSATP